MRTIFYCRGENSLLLRTFLLFVSAIFTFQATTAQELVVTSNDKGKLGYADATSREVVIPCKYDEARSFNGAGYALVNRGGKYGMIDRSGQEVVPLQLNDVAAFKQGVSIVTKGKKKGLLSEKGKFLADPIYSFISDFNVYGLAWVNIGGKVNPKNSNKITGGKWGVIDINGNERIPCQQKSLFEFSIYNEDKASGNHQWTLNQNGWKERDTLVTNGRYFACCEKKATSLYGLLNITDGNGKVIMPADENNTLFFRPESGIVRCIYKINKTDTNYRYYNISTHHYFTIEGIEGNYVAADFKEKIAPVFILKDKDSYQTAFITSDGKISRVYNYATYHATSDSTGQWIACSGNNCTMFDTQLNTIIPEDKYSFARFPDYSLLDFPGYAVRDMNGKWGVVDKEFKEMIPFIYNNLIPSGHWFYAMDSENLWGIIDYKGKQIIEHRFADFIYRTSVKEPIAIFAQTEKNSPYQVYNISEKKLYPEKYSSVYSLDENYTWVIPTNSSSFNNTYANLTTKYIIPAEKELYKEKNISVGFIIDNFGNHVVQSPVTLRSCGAFKPEIDHKINLGKRLTLSDEHRILLEITKGKRVYDLETTIDNTEWDF